MSKELLFSVTKKDFNVTWFSGTGAGGQFRNKHQNCCRIIHRESGAIATGQSQKSREANRKEAFSNIQKSPAFKLWMKMRIADEMYSGISTADQVYNAMSPDKLKVEFMHNGKWVS